MKVARRKKHVQNIREMKLNVMVKNVIKQVIKARIDAAIASWSENLNYSNTSFAFKLITPETKIIHVPD